MKFKREFIGEFMGTFLMVLFGCGAVATSILYNSHQGLLEIGLLWGIGISLAIYATRHLSCAHFNPAVTLAMVTSRRMSLKKMPVYLLGQFTGAFFAALVLYFLFASSIASYEEANQIVRGTQDSVETAKMLAPIVGGQVAGFFFTHFLEPAMSKESTDCCKN